MTDPRKTWREAIICSEPPPPWPETIWVNEPEIVLADCGENHVIYMSNLIVQGKAVMFDSEDIQLTGATAEEVELMVLKSEGH